MARILFISTSTTLGGAEKTLYALATLLKPERFSVAGVVSLKPLGAYGEKLLAQSIPTFTLDMDGTPGPRHIGMLKHIIAGLRPDLVHAFMYQAIQLARVSKIMTRGRFRLVSSPRVTYRTRSPGSLLIDRMLKRADDLLIAESESSRGYLIYSQGYDAEKITTIHNGIAPPETIDPGLRERKRAELGVGEEDILVGALGRLDRQKDQRTLVQAMAAVSNQRVSCVLIGDGPEQTRLTSKINALQLQRRVRLLGEQKDAAAWLCALDIFALPSLWEGLPNALLEAMAAGLPVIASAVDGACEVLKNGVNGLLAAPGQAQELAAKIDELSADPAKRRNLGQAARATIAERFTLDRMLSA
ncbi:MAG: hypothetical protein A3J74_11700, partial [Elusimicrobia bacterium RIFCSPHIGHO2_02_FULL_57_9]